MEPIARTPRKTSKLLELLQITKKYKILLDESISYFPKEEREKEVIWCEYIPAYKGHIYLSSASPIELAFFSESIGKINTIEKELGNEVRTIKMDGEGIIYFSPSSIRKVFKLAGAKTNRKKKNE
jgi:hypothetical protein